MGEWEVNARGKPRKTLGPGSTIQEAVIPNVRLWNLMWTVGIIEGEGSFVRNGRNAFKISVGQKDPWLLEKLVKLYGGGISHQRKDKVTGCWVWQLNGGRARGLANAIEPYLSPRRRTQLEKARSA